MKHLINKFKPTFFISPLTYQSIFHHKPALTIRTACIVFTSLAIVGCFDDNDSNSNIPPEPIVISESKLIDAPVLIKTFTVAELKQALIDANYNDKTSKTPVCGMSVYYMNHTTTGLNGEATNATGAVMTPFGDDPVCQGDRPITLYAHGTTPTKSYNLAALDKPNNAAYTTALVAGANFAGQGDILVAPNYPGYDKSDLSYAPYITDQQGRQMLDALQAGKLTVDAINETLQSTMTTQSATVNPVKYNNKLFVTGFSQGGYVTMSTAKILEKAGQPATAVSPGSGPYALEAYADSIFSGDVIAGGTIFLPMLATSYDAEYSQEYGDIIDAAFSTKYASAPSIFVTDTPIPLLFFKGKLPVTQLFQSAPTDYANLNSISPAKPKYAFGFDANNYLFASDFRSGYVADMNKHPDAVYTWASSAKSKPISFPNNGDTLATNVDSTFRQLIKDNDLRNYMPKSPMMLCGGNQDPTVFFDVNTYSQALIWQNNSQTNYAMVDVDISNINQRSTTGKLAYISTLPTVINNSVSYDISKIQSNFSEALTEALDNVYTNAYDKAISRGDGKIKAREEGFKAKQAFIFSSYHSFAGLYCADVANAFFDQYR